MNFTQGTIILPLLAFCLFPNVSYSQKLHFQQSPSLLHFQKDEQIPSGKLSTDSNYIISIKDNDVRIWERITGRKVFSNRYSIYGINDVALDLKNNILLVGNAEGDLIKTDFENKRDVVFEGLNDQLGDETKVGFSKSEKFIYLESENSDGIFIWSKEGRFTGFFSKNKSNEFNLSDYLNKTYQKIDKNWKIKQLLDKKEVLVIYNVQTKKEEDEIDLGKKYKDFEENAESPSLINNLALDFDSKSNLCIKNDSFNLTPLEVNDLFDENKSLTIQKGSYITGYYDSDGSGDDFFYVRNRNNQIAIIHFYNPGSGNRREMDVWVQKTSLDSLPTKISQSKEQLIPEQKPDSIKMPIPFDSSRYKIYKGEIVKLPPKVIIIDPYTENQEPVERFGYIRIFHSRYPLIHFSTFALSDDRNVLIGCYNETAIEIINLKNQGSTHGTLAIETDNLNFLKISPDGKKLITGNSSGIYKIWDLEDYFVNHNLLPNPILTCISSSDSTFSYFLPNSYYYANKDVLKRAYFVDKLQSIGIGQFDVLLNRPDLVVEKICALTGNYDSLIIAAHKRAWLERVKVLMIDTTLLIKDVSIPTIQIKNKKKLPSETTEPILYLNLFSKSKDSKLIRLNVWVNDVPLYGKNGIDLTNQNTKIIDTTIKIELSFGENSIKIDAVNSEQIHSNEINHKITYRTENKSANVYFFGIGVDNYKNLNRSLTLCVRDIKDLSKMFLERYPNMIIDTSFDKNVTRDKVLSIKNKLLKTSVNDIIILAYSGHGVIDTNSHYFLCTYDTKFDNPKENSIPYYQFEDLLDSIPARRKLALIDACHSGEFDSSDIQKLLDDNSVIKKDYNYQNKLLYKINNESLSFDRYDLMKLLFNDFSNFTGSTIIASASAIDFAQEDERHPNGYFVMSILKAREEYPTITVNELNSFISNSVFSLSGGMQRPISRHELNSFDWNIW